MTVRKVIYAEEGKILTDGTLYGTQIFLADGVSEDNFYEITQEEYEKLFEKANEIVDSEV